MYCVMSFGFSFVCVVVCVCACSVYALLRFVCDLLCGGVRCVCFGFCLCLCVVSQTDLFGGMYH